MELERCMGAHGVVVAAPDAVRNFPHGAQLFASFVVDAIAGGEDRLHFGYGGYGTGSGAALDDDTAPA